MPGTILVVEDSQNIRRFIRTTLDLEGYRVLEAATVQNGLDVARRELPDLVLLDLALPDGTGWDFLESLQAQPAAHGLRVAILTASADRGMADRGLAAGAIAFITKPISAGDLVASVRRLLDANPPTPDRSK